MKLFFSTLGALAIAASLCAPNDARACGGCFHVQQGEVSQVTGHRMIFSVSKDQTTLWDEITYSGKPESFAWVLPIHGQVDVGVSSDALFYKIDDTTRVKIYSPSVECPSCPGDNNTGGAGGGSGTTSSETVTVLAQGTVGPFEMVQLSSMDPAALEDWLTMHSYAIPADVQPIIAAYVSEGFDFLALKLVPGQDISAMRPVRVSTPGAGLGLPLRMVAAGTGAITPITLFVASEGRYEPTNFPWATIDPMEVVWDWNTESSNYSKLVHDKAALANGKTWVVESALPTIPTDIGDDVLQAAKSDPKGTGYGDDSAAAATSCQKDLDALYGKLSPASFWLTRLHAELPKAALATDLQLGAASAQNPISNDIYTFSDIGTPPCPPLNCGGEGGAGGTGGTGGKGGSANGGSAAGGTSGTGAGQGGSGANGTTPGGNGSCNCTIPTTQTPFSAALAAIGLAMMLARRNKRSPRHPRQ